MKCQGEHFFSTDFQKDSVQPKACIALIVHLSICNIQQCNFNGNELCINIWDIMDGVKSWQNKVPNRFYLSMRVKIINVILATVISPKTCHHCSIEI